MFLFNRGIFGFNTTSMVEGTMYGLDYNNSPTNPLDPGIKTDTKDTTPIFDWLTSIDIESDDLTYELSIYNAITHEPIGSATVSGLDLPHSVWQQLRSYGISSTEAISALYSMSAYVLATWLQDLSDGSYGMKVRASDGITYSEWSDDLFFYIDALDPPDLVLIPKHSKIEIHWTNPIDSTFEKTIIAYSIFGYPDIEAEYLQGVIVEDHGPPGSFGTFIHENLINGIRYYYTAVSYDADGSTAATYRSAIPIPATSVKNFMAVSRENKLIIMWDNPTSIEFPNFNGVILRYSTTGYPTIHDGELLYEGVGNYYIHEGLTNGTRYYYSMWTVDTFAEVIEPNVTATAIPIDITGPTGQVTINKGDADTYTTYVDLEILAVDAGSVVIEMMISNYSDFRDGRWEIYTRKKEWVLLYTEGVRFVYVKLKDAFENVSEVISASIDLKFDWINKIKITKSAIVGLTNHSRYGVGLVARSDKFIALWADGEQYDLFLNRRRIKTYSGNGVLEVDGKILSKYRYYAP